MTTHKNKRKKSKLIAKKLKFSRIHFVSIGVALVISTIAVVMFAHASAFPLAKYSGITYPTPTRSIICGYSQFQDLQIGPGRTLYCTQYSNLAFNVTTQQRGGFYNISTERFVADTGYYPYTFGYTGGGGSGYFGCLDGTPSTIISSQIITASGTSFIGESFKQIGGVWMVQPTHVNLVTKACTPIETTFKILN